MPFILALDAHNSKTVFDPHLLLLENNQHATVKLSATLQKILGSALRATLIFQNVKVALNPLPIFFFSKFAESLIVACLLFSNNKILGVSSFVFDL